MLKCRRSTTFDDKPDSIEFSACRLRFGELYSIEFLHYYSINVNPGPVTFQFRFSDVCRVLACQDGQFMLAHFGSRWTSLQTFNFFSLRSSTRTQTSSREKKIQIAIDIWCYVHRKSTVFFSSKYSRGTYRAYLHLWKNTRHYRVPVRDEKSKLSDVLETLFWVSSCRVIQSLTTCRYIVGALRI